MPGVVEGENVDGTGAVARISGQLPDLREQIGLTAADLGSPVSALFVGQQVLFRQPDVPRQPGGTGAGDQCVRSPFHYGARHGDRAAEALQGANGSGSPGLAVHDGGVEFDDSVDVGVAGIADGVIVWVVLYGAHASLDSVQGRCAVLERLPGGGQPEAPVLAGNDGEQVGGPLGLRARLALADRFRSG